MLVCLVLLNVPLVEVEPDASVTGGVTYLSLEKVDCNKQAQMRISTTVN